jgi:hypothetical protein
MLLVFLLLLPLIAGAVVQDVTDGLDHFEKLALHRGRGLRGDDGLFHLNLVFESGGGVETSLVKDNELFPMNYELLVNSALTPVLDTDVNCIYNGPTGTFSFCHGGVSGSHGDLYITTSKKEGVIAFRDIRNNTNKCGDEEAGTDDAWVDPPINHETDEVAESGAVEGEGGSKIKYIKLLLVSDLRRYQNFGSRQAVLQSTKAIAAQLKQIYSKFPNTLSGYVLQLQIVGIVSIENGENPWGVFPESEVDPSQLLRAFNTWRTSMRNKLPEHGVAHLLSGASFRGPIVGLANLDTVCSTDWASGVNQATDPSDHYVAKILAHELGHSLGFRHTNTYQDGGAVSLADAKSCSRDLINVMQPMIYSSAYKWDTDCSPKWLRARFEGYPYNCLPDECTYKKIYGTRYATLCMETPSRDIFTSNVCGDGIIDPAEECDDFSQCCKSCKLAPGAQCSLHQSCCDPTTCQVAPSTQLCRGVKGGCDVEEYCNGVNFSCPPDLKNKTCTHEQQCLFLIKDYPNIAGECPRAGDLTLSKDPSCKALYCLRRTDLYCNGDYKDSTGKTIMVEDGTPCYGGEGVCKGQKCVTNTTSPTKRPTTTRIITLLPTTTARRPSTQRPITKRPTTILTKRPSAARNSTTSRPTFPTRTTKKPTVPLVQNFTKSPSQSPIPLYCKACEQCDLKRKRRHG